MAIDPKKQEQGEALANGHVEPVQKSLENGTSEQLPTTTNGASQNGDEHKSTDGVSNDAKVDGDKAADETEKKPKSKPVIRYDEYWNMR